MFWNIIKGMIISFVIAVILLGGLQLAMTGELFLEWTRAVGLWIVLIVVGVLRHTVFKER